MHALLCPLPHSLAAMQCCAWPFKQSHVILWRIVPLLIGIHILRLIHIVRPGGLLFSPRSPAALPAPAPRHGGWAKWRGEEQRTAMERITESQDQNCGRAELSRLGPRLSTRAGARERVCAPGTPGRISPLTVYSCAGWRSFTAVRGGHSAERSCCGVETPPTTVFSRQGAVGAGERLDGPLDAAGVPAADSSSLTADRG